MNTLIPEEGHGEWGIDATIHLYKEGAGESPDKWAEVTRRHGGKEQTPKGQQREKQTKARKDEGRLAGSPMLAAQCSKRERQKKRTGP